MPQRWYQKATVQAAVIGGAFVVVAALIGLYRRDVLDLGTSKPVAPKAHAQSQNPNPVEMSNDKTYSAGGLSERARLRNELRLLAATESGLLPNKVPLGTYAFAHPNVLRYGESEMLRTPDYGRFTFEVQKRQDGVLYVVAFVNADEHRKLALNNKITGPVTLYSDFWDEARYAVLVEAISCHGKSRFVTLDDGAQIDAVDCEPLAQQPEKKSKGGSRR